MGSYPKLELFYFESCPFCVMVIRHIRNLKIKVDYKNIHEGNENINRLRKDTGRGTVPCLYIDNRPMFESIDIIEWLSNNLSQLEKSE